MPKKTHGLGRGLDALLPDGIGLQDGAVTEIGVGEIDPNPNQPRRSFPEESIAQLAQSLREQGMLQPLLVTAAPGGRYRLVAGERRWRAAREAGLERVPCLVRELDDARQMEIALVENLQREDLSPLETAQGIRSLMDECRYTQDQAAKRLGKSRPAVANALRLLSLPEPVKELLRDGRITAGHARVLCGVAPEEQQIALAERTVREGLSVRQLESAAAHLGDVQPPRPPRLVSGLSVELQGLQDRLQYATGLRAAIRGSEKKGRIVLRYDSRGELEHLLEVLDRLG